jgi:hypothetical protein
LAQGNARFIEPARLLEKHTNMALLRVLNRSKQHRSKRSILLFSHTKRAYCVSSLAKPMTL